MYSLKPTILLEIVALLLINKIDAKKYQFFLQNCRKLDNILDNSLVISFVHVLLKCAPA